MAIKLQNSYNNQLQGSLGTYLQGATQQLQGSSIPLQGTPQKQAVTVQRPAVPKVTSIGNLSATSPKQKYIQDLSEQYGLSGSTVYDKGTNLGLDLNAFKSATGIQNPDWSSLKFDTTYQPGSIAGASAADKNITQQNISSPATTQLSDPMAAYKNAMQSYIESLRPNKNVVEAQQKYADYMTNAKLGISGLEGQGRGIPLSLVRGQQSKLAEQAELTAGRLREEIGIAEGAQQQEQARAKAAADLELGLFTTAEEQRAAARKFAQESALAQKPLTLSEGEAVFDPNTGQIVYKNPKTYAPDRGGSTGSLGNIS